MQQKASQFGFVTRLILGDLADAPERVRDRMLATVPTTPVSLALYSVTLLIICGTTLYISREPWAWVWFGISAFAVVWRSLHPAIEKLRGRPQPLMSIMFSSGLAMASFGFGSVQALRSGSLSLAIMALAGTMGVMAGVATRWAALPRPAIATMVLSIVPPTLELASHGGADVFAAAALALAAVSIITFTARNRESLLASIIATEQLLRQAQTDHLTGLPNRVELLQRLEAACAGINGDSSFAVLYIDLDGFKAVNDNHGHAAGDEMLRDVAGRLRAVLGPEQMVARIGGDEFVALLMDADPLTASGVADAIIAAVSHERSGANGTVMRVGCSIGISVAPEHGRTPETLLRHADTALYSAKSQGKGQTDMFRALEI